MKIFKNGFFIKTPKPTPQNMHSVCSIVWSFIVSSFGVKNMQKNEKIKKNCKLYLPKHSISLRIFSGNLYSGYHLSFFFFFLDICTPYQTTLRGKQHHYTPHCAFNPYVPTQSPCTIHRTQQPRRYFPTWGFPGSRCKQGVGHRKGDPAGQEAIVCHYSAIMGTG